MTTPCQQKDSIDRIDKNTQESLILSREALMLIKEHLAFTLGAERANEKRVSKLGPYVSWFALLLSAALGIITLVR
jgi:hypothetical protein